MVNRKPQLAVLVLLGATINLFYYNDLPSRLPRPDEEGAAECSTSDSKLAKDSSLLHELSELSGSSLKVECDPPLLAFADRVVVGSDDVSGREIPRILHVSMKSRCVARDLFEILNQWLQKLPNYSVFFHDDDAVSRLFQQDWPEFPDLKRVLNCVLSGAMKIDIWRLLVLYKYGGVYTDADNWPMEKLTEDLIAPDLSAFFFSDSWARPSQWFMAMKQGHPIANLTMRVALDNVYALKNLGNPKVVFVTGPHAVKVGYEQFLLHREGIFGGSDPTFVGMYNMTVRKINENVGSYIMGKYKWDEIVPYNATVNLTRGTRYKLESDVQHWTTTRSEGEKPQVSCIDYLAQLEHTSR